MSIYPCGACAMLDLGHAFDVAQEPDSAIAFYEKFLSANHYVPDAANPWASRLGTRWWDLINRPWVHERLGALYEATGNRERAAAHLTSFIDYWKDADPELQPRVSAARVRLTRLKAS
jgi:tetratricopeptide (TPR) repeat protein